MTLGDKELSSKSTKNRIISYIIKNGAASRKEIAKHLGVTTATLTIATAALIEAGILVELGTVEEGKVGRKQVMLDVKSDLWFAVGVDVTSTALCVTILNIKSDILEERTWKYKLLTESILKESMDYLDVVMQKYKEKRILGIGLLMQGYVENELCYTLPIHDIKEKFSVRFTVPVFMMNNVKGLAVAEYYFGNATQNFLLVKYGPGVGGVIVVNGEIVEGFHNRAGEIGHIRWNDQSDKVCGICGKKGCLETLVHFSTILGKLGQDGEKIDCDLCTILELSAQDQFRTLNDSLSTLAEATSVFVDILDPDQIYLAGDIFKEDPLFQHFLNEVNEKSGIESSRIKRVEEYRTKRRKASGVIVLNEYFGKGDMPI